MSKSFGIVLSLVSTLIIALMQLVLKKASGKDWGSRIREYLNVPVVSAYFISFLATFLGVYSMKYIPVAVYAVILGSGQVFVPLISAIFLKEKLSRRKWLGIIIMTIGIILVSLP